MLVRVARAGDGDRLATVQGMELRVVRYTDLFDETCHFYGELLGWPLTRHWPASGDQGRGHIYGYGDVGRVELIEGPPTGGVDGVFLSIEYDGVDALFDRLVAAGVLVLREPADQPWGHHSMSVQDPTGLAVTFFEWLPGSRPHD